MKTLQSALCSAALILICAPLALAQRGGGPGPVEAPFQPTNVPHGTVAAVWYPSPVTGAERRMIVYTPPGYESSDSRYPVLYLFHGGGGNEDNWLQQGLANVMLDNLIAAGTIEPMIVVMPNANWDNAAAPAYAPGAAPTGPGPATGPGRGGPGGGPGGAPPMGLDFAKGENDIVNGQIRYMDAHYRTQANREGRAIAGLSMGGGIAINIGLKRLDQFAYVGEFSSGMFGGVEGAAYEPFDVETLSPGFLDDPAATNARLKVLYFSCGTEDPRMPFTADAANALSESGIDVTLNSFPGGHEFSVWRDSLEDFSAMLFR